MVGVNAGVHDADGDLREPHNPLGVDRADSSQAPGGGVASSVKSLSLRVGGQAGRVPAAPATALAPEVVFCRFGMHLVAGDRLVAGGADRLV